MKVVGIILIVLGIIALIYGGITYTTHKKVLDIGTTHPGGEERNPQYSAATRSRRDRYRRRRGAFVIRRQKPVALDPV